MLARGEADQVKGTRGQGDMGTGGRGREAKSYRGKDTERQRYRGAKIQGDKIWSQKFRVGWNRREFKSVNYNYLNQL